MSSRIMALCWPLQMPPECKALLIAMADSASEDGAAPSSPAARQSWLERTCLSEEVVCAALMYLNKAGVVRAGQRWRHANLVLRPDQFDATLAPHWPHRSSLGAPRQGAPAP